MEKQNDSMRERLLARLPQPENLAAYREETASLLAKHEKALFWEKVPSIVSYLVAVLMVALWLWGKTPSAAMRQYFWPLAALAYFGGAVVDLRYRIYRSEVNTLKEVKQVQLQVLELQASIGKVRDQQS
jgi:hypothetical protein